MRPEQVLDLQVETADWWRTQIGHGFGDAFYASMFKNSEAAKESPADWGPFNLAEHERHNLLNAETYHVTHDMSLAVEAMAQALPDEGVEVDVRMPMHERGFVYLDRPLYVTDVRGSQLACSAFAWSIQTTRLIFGKKQDTVDVPSVVLSFYGRTDDEHDEALLQLYKDRPEARNTFGKLSLWHIQPMLHGHTIEPDAVLQRFVWTFWKVTNQRIARWHHTKPSRPFARRAHRAGKITSEILVVTLRRDVQEGGANERPDGAQLFWFSHRFLVHGHWHYYWVGSGAERHKELRWVDTFVKGPDDAPLLIKDTVWKVSR